MEPKQGKNQEDIVLFGAVDRKLKRSDEEIASSYPAWYSEQKVETLQEEYDTYERAITYGLVPREAEPEHRMQMKIIKQRLDEIRESKPRLNIAQKNWLTKTTNELKAEIDASRFPHNQMQSGEASPQQEMLRMTRPCIKMDPLLARQCGIKLDPDGKCSRNQAEKAWKIATKALGGDSHSDNLQRAPETTYRTQKVTPFVGENIGRRETVEGTERTA